jgi:hypothetical protein
VKTLFPAFRRRLFTKPRVGPGWPNNRPGPGGIHALESRNPRYQAGPAQNPWQTLLTRTAVAGGWNEHELIWATGESSVRAVFDKALEVRALKMKIKQEFLTITDTKTS